MFDKWKEKAIQQYNTIIKKNKQEPYEEMNEEQQKEQQKETQLNNEIIVPNQEIKQENKVQQEIQVQQSSNRDKLSDSKPKEQTNNIGTLELIKNQFTIVGDYIEKKVAIAQKSVKEQIDKVDKSVKETILKQKKSFNKWIAIKLDTKITKSLKSMESKISRGVEKAVPSKCCFDFVNDTVLSLWSDTTDLIRFELRVSLETPQITLSQRPDQNRWLKPWYILRNWILYSLYPYDVELGKQIRSISYIFIKIIQLIPYYGIQAFAYVIIFLAIDKTEEYQVVNYILDYKNVQFFSAGLFSAIIGFLQYFYCATLIPIENEKQQIIAQEYEQSYCIMYGPGANSHLILSLIGYFTQIILIWSAFAVLHRTKSRADFINNQLKNQEQVKRGGRLTSFMIYDLSCFIITCLITLYIYYEYYYVETDLMKMLPYIGNLVFFAKLTYGFLSLPFVIFIIPFFVRMFTTAVPTAYDQYGNVVPCIAQIKLTYQELPLEATEEIDIEEVLKEE